MKQNETVYTLTHTLMLLAASFLWGTTFVAQSIGARYVGAGTYLAVRTYMGILFLLPFVLIRDRQQYLPYKGEPEKRKEKRRQERKNFLLGGCIAGFFLFMGSFTQQIGIAYTSVAKASFLTALYVVLVPIIALFFGKKQDVKLWICVLLAVAGLYLLCMTESFSLEKGDALMLAAALAFSGQILAVDHFSVKIDPVKLTFAEFIIEGILATIPMLVMEKPDLTSILQALPAIAYAGIFSSGIAYTLQSLGQKNLNPAIASIAMCLESVFGTLAGWVILNQTLTMRETFGCILMFLAIILTQIPICHKIRKK
ncbi:MAG: DMT family transporter [Lachnospiraceae bacterium]|nr:DMT family transporter [Lachnospiraceae bacterium]